MSLLRIEVVHPTTGEVRTFQGLSSRSSGSIARTVLEGAPGRLRRSDGELLDPDEPPKPADGSVFYAVTEGGAV